MEGEKNLAFSERLMGFRGAQEAAAWSLVIGMRINWKADVSMHVSVCRVGVLRSICDWSVF